MTFPKARLAVAAVLFLSWIGFLGYLVATSSKIILSRPQFLVAQMFVVVDAKGDSKRSLNPEVTIEKVLWSAQTTDQSLIGKTITLPELVACGKKQGNVGPGKYVLPLQRNLAGELEIAAVPRFMQFPTTPATHGTVEWSGIFSHRIYRRLPIDDALDMQQQARKAGYSSVLRSEEIRVYAWNAGTQAQVDELIELKKQATVEK